MALVPGNLVHETSVTTGTGNQTLVAVDGKRTFNTEHGTGGADLFDYFISNPDAAEWERGTGHMSDSTTLVRDTVIQSSNGDAAVSFTAGIKNVTNDLPSSEQSGIWDLLETVVADDDTTIDITGLSSTHFAYKFVWSAIENTATANMRFRTDANAGASFDAGGSDYGYVLHYVAMDATSPDHIVIGDDLSTLSVIIQQQLIDTFADHELTLFNPSATEFTKWVFGAVYDNNTAGFHVHVLGAGARLSAALVDAVQYSYTAGNIFTGTLKIYGMRA